MGILNLTEHKNCHHYATLFTEGFEWFEEECVTVTKESLKSHLILFQVEGSLDVNSDDHKIKIKPKEFLFFAKGSSLTLHTDQPSKFLLAYFETVNFLCDKITLEQLRSMQSSIEREFKPLEVRYPLEYFIQTMCCYLKDGASCSFLHELKLKELFWLFRAYYSLEELANLLYPMLEVTDFKEIIVKYFKPNCSVSDLANRSLMSEKNFIRVFSREFNETPGAWIRARTTDQVKYFLQDTDLNFSEIAEKLNFSSLQSFSRYCSQNLGDAPGKIRETLQEQRNIPCQDKMRGNGK